MPEIHHDHIRRWGAGLVCQDLPRAQPINNLGSDVAHSFHVDAPCSDGSTVKQGIHHETEVFPPKFGGSDEHGG